MDMEILFFGVFFIGFYFIEIFINFFVVYFFIKLIIQAFKRTKTNNFFKNNVISNNSNIKANFDDEKKYKNNYNDVSKDKLAKFNTDDINLLKDYFYEIFYKFESAYNNLDYNTMKLLSTKELYQNYHTGISLNLKVGKKRIIDRIQRKKVIIYELDSTSMKQIASLMIEVSYINYTIDKKGYLIAGSRDVPITEKFEVVFRKDFERKKITHCYNCGAALTGSICDYCKSNIKEVDFKISSIRKIVN